MGSQRYIVLPADENRPEIYIAFKMEENREEEYSVGDTVDEFSDKGLVEITGVSINDLREYDIIIRDGVIISAVPA